MQAQTISPTIFATRCSRQRQLVGKSRAHSPQLKRIEPGENDLLPVAIQCHRTRQPESAL